MRPPGTPSGFNPVASRRSDLVLNPPAAGSAVVDWLVFMQLALTRVEAMTLASALLEEGLLRTVGAKSAEALRTAGLSEQFLDDSTALYSFVGAAAAPGRQVGGRSSG